MNKDNIRRILLGIGITFFLLIILIVFGYVIFQNLFQVYFTIFLFRKIHVVIFGFLIGFSYKLTDYYLYV